MLSHRTRRVSAVAAAFALLLLARPFTPVALAATGDGTAAAADASPATVSADALPTVQIDGVVWKQVIAGNTVYAGGEFTTARPAGSPAGVNTVPRSNLLAYNIDTGALDTSFAPTFNGKISDMAVTPDGTKLVVVGNFTQVNGVNRYRVAVFNLPSGTLNNAAPALNAAAYAVAVTNTTMYVGGIFSTVGKTAVSRVASMKMSNGALLPFAVPVDSYAVRSIVVSPDSSQVVLAGTFTSVGSANTPGYGLYRADATTGAGMLLPINTEVRDAGANAGILRLASDGTSFYGGGYVFGSGGNSEGYFQGSWSDGSLVNLEDCHGDTYDIAPIGDVVYQTGHHHYCGNSGGFPQTSPDWTIWHSTAWTKATQGANTADIYGYPDHPGTPRPGLLAWFPDMASGTYTGQGQAAWAVTGNSKYVLYGGEFPTVNGTPQQGLVRFAVRSAAPNKQGPRPATSTGFTPTAQSYRRGQVKISWPAMWDRDDKTLTYQVIRQTASNVVYSTQQTNFQWNGTAMSFTDTSVAPGTATRYQVIASDSSGNSYNSEWMNVTVADGDLVSPYGNAVLNDGATKYWPLDEPAGNQSVVDWAGTDTTTAGSGVTRAAAGALQNSTDTASTFDGTVNDLVASTQPVPGPDVFSQEVWFKTTSKAGGKIAGFGNSNTGDSSAYDRHLYMDTSGRLLFGVYPGSSQTVQSATGLNNGQWHQAVATLGPNGMVLYVDGVKVASRTDVTNGQSYTGYWRLGGDNTWSGGKYFNGSIDEYSVYPSVLTPRQVDSHWVASGRSSALPPAPADALGKAMFTSQPDLYWRLGETGATTTAADAATGANTGTYTGNVTKNQAGVAGGTAIKLGAAVGQFQAGGNVTAKNASQNPTAFSQEVWVKTNTTTGGRIFGFGSSANGTASSNYDRHLYMLDNGKVRFGVYNGSTVTIDSSASLNDNAWHQVVSTFDSSGMKLYVDGKLNSSDPNAIAQNYSGYWKLGGDSTWGGNTSTYFSGLVDEAAVYPRALTLGEIQDHYSAAGNTVANVPPTAAFTSSASDLTASFDASGSSDTDGTIASYAWNFGDGSAAGSGVKPDHAYASAGTYTATLTVTDNRGTSTVVSHDLTVVAPNVKPTAAFSSTATALAASFDASGSADSDGSIASYAWDFGDGTAAGSGVKPDHAYASGGTYAVKLTVTDNRGGTDVVTHQITVAKANVKPTAAFTAGAKDLTASFDATGSGDTDGSIASYAWDFGDGTAGSGAKPDHTYAAAGTYTAVLTVTDDAGATDKVTHSVAVTAPVAPMFLAADEFARSLALGWGTADTGGSWTVRGGTSLYSVSGGAGNMVVPSGSNPHADLTAVKSDAARVTATFSVDKIIEANYVAVVGRQVGSDYYAARLRISADGTGRVYLLHNSTQLGTTFVPSFTIVPGQSYTLSMEVKGTSPTTISAKLWKSSDAEPSGWTKTTTDSSGVLQAAGTVGLFGYLPVGAANAPVTIAFDKVTVTQAQ